MKKYGILIFVLLNFASIWGQKEAANWFFGERAGLNFNTKIPTSQTGSLTTREGCAAISNSKGSLLFYTDGSTLWNKSHGVMPNGTDLFGNNSSTQSAIIIPKPNSDNIYYVFTVNNAEKFSTNEVKRGLNYSIVDMNLDLGKGDVLPDSKNTHLITYNQNDAEQSDWKCSEKVAATISEDETFYWVLTYFVDTFYAFKVDENGITEDPVTTRVNDVIPIVEWQDVNTTLSNISSLGYLKISPNGKKIAIAHSATAKTRTSGKVFVYDFDNTTGIVSTNGKQLLGGTYPYGLEFSPKSRKLYVSANNYVTIRGVSSFNGSQLFQYDLENPDIISTKTEIHRSPTLLAGALQLAINGKIYRAKQLAGTDTGESSLAAIDKPELSGNNANYINNGAALSSGTKSAYGLPPFISSTFILSFDYEFTCIGDDTHFFITSEDPYDSLIWDFGDGTTSTEEEPYHRYAEPGEYTVYLTTKYNDFENKPLKKKIEIIGAVEVLAAPYTFIECDVDENTEDGITTFNLQLANDPLSMGNGDDVEVFYYKDLVTLANDSLNNKALPNFYTNIEPNELIYAKVLSSGSDCYNTGEVVLRATKSIEFSSEPIIGCNLGDGTAEFDLASRKESIISDLGLNADTEITFHIDQNNASLGYEPLDEVYIDTPKKIFIRVSNDNICYGVGEMQLEMPELPNINLDETYNICQSSFPLQIEAGIELSDVQNYTYEWLDGQNTYAIDVDEEGEYYITITDRLTLCSLVKSIKINTIVQPIVKKIELQENVGIHTATVHLENDGDFEYALNNSFGFYQSDPVFTDLVPGSYSVFIRDTNNCNIVEKKFFIFGFLKYFTPDGDGEVDVWEVKGLNPVDFSYSDIQIFNRYGKLLAVLGPDDFWDGTYNGKFLPSDDYWFTVTVTDEDNISTTYTKHFSLIRNN